MRLRNFVLAALVWLIVYIFLMDNKNLWPQRSFPRWPKLTEYIHIHDKQASQFMRDQEARMVIYSCDDRRSCGGIGDRLNMICTAFLVALLTDRGFGIHHTVPVQLEEMMHPAYIDWVAPGYVHDIHAVMAHFGALDTCAPFDAILNASRFDESRILEFYGNCNGLRALLQNPFLRTKLQHYDLLELDRIGRLRHTILRFLFTPSEQVRKEMLHLPPGVGVGIHIRTGGDGDWDDPGRNSLQSVTVFAQAAKTFRPQFFYGASDSQKALAALGQQVHPLLTSDPLEIAHTDRSSRSRSQLRTVVDWFMLAQMHYLVLSRSGFSETASQYSCQPAILHCTDGTLKYQEQGACESVLNQPWCKF